MRELKFRVYDKDLGKYLEGCEIDSLMADLCSEGDGRAVIIKQLCPARYIFEQYTGLKDKNGKEIYENDIVEYTTCYYGKEKRHRKVAEWSEWDSDDFGEPHNIGYSNLSECMVVIGNVHENADLLEDKK